ncbi:DUF1433 domain-containing protein [Streptococcus ruminantium]|uniref:DUF1433 domain-containing protein n=1 Tax=Streptococcus ruminantium TaxID=1917441 RepID=UPI0012DD0BAF|nr:DUF1433 domain-containing protein [Streptococcus ruminantium]
MKIKQVLASLFILIGMMSLLLGCKMDNKDKINIVKEQERMALFLKNNYEDIRRIEFTSFSKNQSTQTWTSNAIVNSQVYVSFSIQRLSDDSDIGFGQHIKKSNNVKLQKKIVSTTSDDITDIELIYWEK